MTTSRVSASILPATTLGFEEMAAAKAQLREELRRAGASHPTVRLVWDEARIEVDYEIEADTEQAAYETAVAVTRTAAQAFWGDALTVRVDGVTDPV